MSEYSFYTRNGSSGYENSRILERDSLSVKHIKNGIILPAKQDPNGEKMWAIGGVVDNNGDFVKDTAFPHSVFGGDYLYDTSVKINETVVFLGPLVYHWGHFICDLISRLWFVLDNPEKYKIAYCGWYHGNASVEISGNFLRFFNLLGIKKSQLIDIQEPTQFKEIIIPDVSMSVRDRFFTKEYKKIFNTVTNNAVKNCPKEIPEKVYFTREKFVDAQEKEYGEKYISEFFKNNGYEILAPETLSLDMQIIYFQKCKKIAAVSGTITHNMLFASKSLDLIVINKLDLVNNYQTLIDATNKNKVILVDAYKMFLPVLFGKGPFLFEPNRYLRKFAIDNDYVLPKGLFLKDRVKSFLWYIRKYYSIYKEPLWREMLYNQQKAMKI